MSSEFSFRVLTSKISLYPYHHEDNFNFHKSFQFLRLRIYFSIHYTLKYSPRKSNENQIFTSKTSSSSFFSYLQSRTISTFSHSLKWLWNLISYITEENISKIEIYESQFFFLLSWSWCEICCLETGNPRSLVEKSRNFFSILMIRSSGRMKKLLGSTVQCSAKHLQTCCKFILND